MALTQKELEYWLSSVSKLGPVKTKRLLDYFGSEEEIYKAQQAQWLQVEGITELVAQEMLCLMKEDVIKEKYEKMLLADIRLVSIHDSKYPKRLSYIEKAPYSLFYKGRMPREELVSVAIVGARNCTSYGKEMALWFGRELSKAGIQVISGMALGIDGFAHRGALQGETATYAVLGSGIDVCYPRENFNLYMELHNRGGVLSEYGPGVKGAPFQFPMRNRIISGISDAVLVVEAREKSGSLITADLALEQGKDIFAIPGKVLDPLSCGCNNLIKQGAQIVEHPKEIVENFHINEIKCMKKMKKNNILLDSPEKIVYANLSLMPKHLNQILAETNMLMSDVIGVLVKLELDGFVRQTSPNCYVRRLIETDE